MGWIGYIAGCDFKFSFNSIYIILNTLIAACASGIVWTAIDFFFSSVPLEGESVGLKHGDSKLSNSLGDNHSPMLQAIVSRTGVSINQRLHESKSNFVEKESFP